MAEYFSHDYGSRNDPKLVKLQMKLGHEGKGIFWDLVEIMYEQGGYITKEELEGIAFALHTKYERITDVLHNFDLFQNDGERYWSNSVISRLKMRSEKSEKARKSVLKRWNNNDNDTNVIRTYNDGNTKKERKGKESKEKKEKEINIPTLQDVKNYFAENGYSESVAERAYEFYNVADWHDSKGKKVRNWKQKMQSVWFKDENKVQVKKQLVTEQNPELNEW